MLKKITNFTPEEFESAEHPFSIKRLSPLIGAELHDIDLSKDLSEEEKEHIYGALLTYKVIFFSRSRYHYRTSFTIWKIFWRIRNSSFCSSWNKSR